MAKCYLMIEDGAGGISFAGDFGVPGEELPEDVNDLTEAQYTLHQFLAVLRGMAEPDQKLRNEQEARSQILLPGGKAD